MSIVSQAKVAELVDKSPSDWRVTEESMERRIKKVEFHRLPGTTVTLCNITLDNGYSVRGESACVDPANYNEDVGQTIAKRNAFQKLWPLFGFLVAEMKFRHDAQNEEQGIFDAMQDQEGL